MRHAILSFTSCVRLNGVHLVSRNPRVLLRSGSSILRNVLLVWLLRCMIVGIMLFSNDEVGKFSPVLGLKCLLLSPNQIKHNSAARVKTVPLL